MKTEAQQWLDENIESGEWRNQPKGVWTARQLFQLLNDHACGDHTWCAFIGKAGVPGQRNALTGTHGNDQSGTTEKSLTPGWSIRQRLR